MERTQRVAKLEALLARVQSRAGTNGARLAAVSSATAEHATARAVQPSASPSPRAPHVQPAPVLAAAPEPTPSAADDSPTAIHSLDIEATMAAAADSGTVRTAPVVAAPAPAPIPAPAPAPAFRGVSALGALSKKATLIGTAPPANWPPRGAETSVVTEAPKPSPAEQAAAEPPPAPAPDLQASEAGDVDALMGGEEHAGESEAQVIPAHAIEVQAMPTPAPVDHIADDVAPVIQREKKVAPKRSASPVLAFIIIWLILIVAIWFAYKKSI